jgi:hypothetical protein
MLCTSYVLGVLVRATPLIRTCCDVSYACMLCGSYLVRATALIVYEQRRLSTSFVPTRACVSKRTCCEAVML